MPKLTCHCGCVEAEINVPINELPKIVRFDKRFLKDVDLIFTALPNGESQKISNYLWLAPIPLIL